MMKKTLKIKLKFQIHFLLLGITTFLGGFSVVLMTILSKTGTGLKAMQVLKGDGLRKKIFWPISEEFASKSDQI